MTTYREEADTLGPVKIPADALWGPQTERSRHNFPHGALMPVQVIRALLQIKQAAAQVNQKLGTLAPAKAVVIEQTVRQLLALDDAALMADFPLHVYQTGSGTQTNMNVNEVLAHLAAKIDPATPVLLNDDLNQSQSSNDTFPTAMNIAATLALKPLETQLEALIAALTVKQQQYWRTVKIGRTHLQDATPLTFGQEVSGWVSMLQHDLHYLQQLAPTLLELPIGGTAVGTGLNTQPSFATDMTTQLAAAYGVDFVTADNDFAGLAAHSGLNVVHGALKTLAADLVKIGNDIRFLASGPRAGYGELTIPANEPGSSIMPGKVNPTQIEALTMAAARVMGNDTTIDFAASQGNFEMNVYKPVIIAAFLESTELLSGTIEGLTTKLVVGLTVNEDRMRALVDESLMTVTALSPHIGYHHAAEIAQLAEKEGTTLRTAALKTGYVQGEDFDQWVDPLKMTNIDRH
ncbi:fumarate hydratase [Lactiplantibacillus fabifermentans T30PCM01]|uniref:Fumarate hydratase class II n=1 Tax=Lactiplantibacillus fabifermentans T30PCM01 TaxID=1400520 RepID=W6T5W5_9LACO|nr:class II fumarate hydratase [Lactiplantibacillus fabifermentans]ETY73496.1 fumarate hydratase [Lactiplantibacillus fabifermentans T30PCM01]